MQKIPLNEDRFIRIQKLLLAHDYNFQYSDDKKAYSAGRSTFQQLKTMCQTTVEAEYTEEDLLKSLLGKGCSGASYFTQMIEGRSDKFKLKYKPLRSRTNL